MPARLPRFCTVYCVFAYVSSEAPEGYNYAPTECNILHDTVRNRDDRFAGNERCGSRGVRSQFFQRRKFSQLGWNSPGEIFTFKTSAQAMNTGKQTWEGGSVSYEAVDAPQ